MKGLNQVRFKRKSYEISYIDSTNGNTLGSTETILFEYDLTGRGTAAATTTPYANMPEVQTYEGKYFTGWYADSACTTKVFFNEPTAAQLAAALKVANDNQINADGTLKYTVYEKMPMKNLVFYAGYNPIRFRVWIQPNGGVISPTEATYFNTDWGEIIERYFDVETSRNYYPDENGTFYYVIFDHENPRRAFYIEDINNPYSYVNGDGDTITVSAEQLQSHVYMVDGQAVKYKEVPSAYTFYGWYEVVNKEMGHYDGTGNGLPPTIEELDETNGHLVPYIFGTPTYHDIAIRAIWRRAGAIQVHFDTMEQSNTVISETGYVYADRAECIAPDAPELTAAAKNAGWTFLGWRTPSGEIVQANDTFVVLADLSTPKDEPGASGTPQFDFYVEAVYVKIENKTTTLTYVVNNPDGSNVISNTLTDLGEALDENGNPLTGVTSTTNGLANIPVNSAIKLSDGTGFAAAGYVLKGWNDDETAADNGEVKFELGKIYGIGAAGVAPGNTLYGVWESISFYVYLSHNCDVVEVTYGDPAFAELFSYSETDGLTFDITGMVTSGYLYGGYYKTYNKKGADFNESDPGTHDEGGTPYTGGAGYWSRSKAYTEDGTKLAPVAGKVYYLKEVPGCALKPWIHLVYNINTGAIDNVYILTVLDDGVYSEYGMNVTDGDGGDIDFDDPRFTARVVIQNSDGSNPAVLTAKTITGTNGLSGGYVLLWQYDELLEHVDEDYTITIRSFFITKDGVMVNSLFKRTIHVGNGKVDLTNGINGNAAGFPTNCQSFYFVDEMQSSWAD